MKRNYNAYMTMLGGQVLELFDLQSEGLGYKSQKQRHEHSCQGRVMAKSFGAAFPLTGKFPVVVVKINAGRWI